MPVESIIAASAIVAVFAIFAGIVIFGDMTWQKPAQRRER